MHKEITAWTRKQAYKHWNYKCDLDLWSRGVFFSDAQTDVVILICSRRILCLGGIKSRMHIWTDGAILISFLRFFFFFGGGGHKNPVKRDLILFGMYVQYKHTKFSQMNSREKGQILPYSGPWLPYWGLGPGALK